MVPPISEIQTVRIAGLSLSLQLPTMTDTAASSPLSDLQEPSTPNEIAFKPSESVPQVDQVAPSSNSESVDALASTSAVAPSSLSTSQKSARKQGRTAKGTFTKKTTKPPSLPLPEEEPCPACRNIDAKNRRSKRRIGTVWVECDK